MKRRPNFYSEGAKLLYELKSYSQGDVHNRPMTESFAGRARAIAAVIPMRPTPYKASLGSMTWKVMTMLREAHMEILDPLMKKIFGDYCFQRNTTKTETINALDDHAKEPAKPERISNLLILLDRYWETFSPEDRNEIRAVATRVARAKSFNESPTLRPLIKKIADKEFVKLGEGTPIQ